MGGLSRSKHEEECGAVCQVKKAVKKVFKPDVKAYDPGPTPENDSTIDQIRRKKAETAESLNY